MTEQHFCNWKFRNKTTEDLLTMLRKDGIDAFHRSDIRLEIECRVVERFIEMGMGEVISDAQREHVKRATARRERAMHGSKECYA